MTNTISNPDTPAQDSGVADDPVDLADERVLVEPSSKSSPMTGATRW
jgi:hypothetical protein